MCLVAKSPRRRNGTIAEPLCRRLQRCHLSTAHMPLKKDVVPLVKMSGVSSIRCRNEALSQRNTQNWDECRKIFFQDFHGRFNVRSHTWSQKDIPVEVVFQYQDVIVTWWRFSNVEKVLLRSMQTFSVYFWCPRGRGTFWPALERWQTKNLLTKESIFASSLG